MAHNQSNSPAERRTKRLSAQDIYALTLETLRAHFGLDRQGCQYDEQVIWDVVIAASVQRETVETMCDVLEESPSANTVHNTVKGVLPADEDIDESAAKTLELTS